MIQRIQTLFWLLGSVASGLMLFNPILRISSEAGSYGLLYAGSLKTEGADDLIFSSVPLLVLILIITLLGLGCIFLFKKRVLQVRLTVYNMVLLVGSNVLSFFY